MTIYEDHIVELCSKYKIKRVLNNGVNSVNMLSKVIWINKNIRTVKTYFGALHEIGHIINEHSSINLNINRVLWNQSRSQSCPFVSKYRMQTEIDAWKCAFDIAKWTNFVADKLTVNCLFTYIYGYNISHKKTYKNIDNDFMCYVKQNHKNDKNVIIGIKKLLFSSTPTD